MAAKKSKWEWWMVLLWGYSILYMLFWLIVIGTMIFGGSTETSTPSASNPIGGIILGALFIPVLIFLILSGRDNL